MSASGSPSRTGGLSSAIKTFENYTEVLRKELRSLAQRFEDRRVGRGDLVRLTDEELEATVDELLDRLPEYDNAMEVTRTALEKGLEATVLCLPSIVSEDWQDDDGHFALYHDLLDVICVFVDRQLVDTALAMNVLEVLLESQTVQHAERLFDYLETRMALLTKGMIPGRGKALVILRTLNDLLRRLSKSTHTVFCGRILLFLASILPLGERSGVNLRGDYNKENLTLFEVEPEPEKPTVEAEEEKIEGTDEKMEEEQTKRASSKDKSPSATLAVEEKEKAEKQPPTPAEAPEDGEEVEEMAVEEPGKVASSKLEPPLLQAAKKRQPGEPEFYTLFWSMQRYFSDPPSLFTHTVHSDLPPALGTYASSFPVAPPLDKNGQISNAPTMAGTPNLTLLREGVSRTIDVFSAASKQEKELQGAVKDGRKGSSKKEESAMALDSLGSVQSTSQEEEVKRMFFYPKYLTSKSLLELEVADSKFRKQVMVQCLVIFRYLLSFTELAKGKLMTSLTHQNKAVTPYFRLTEADAKWVRELETRVFAELSRTSSDGEQFSKTVQSVLQGERNWAFWKANNCQLIEKPPLPDELSSKALENKKKLLAPTPSYPHSAGTGALSRLWKNESKTPEESVQPSRQAELQTYFEKVKRQNELIKFRKEELAEEGRKSAAEQAGDAELQGLEEKKASLAWRTLRIVSSTQLHLFGKIGVNDVERLMEEMAKPVAVPVSSQTAAPVPPVTVSPAVVQDASVPPVKEEEEAKEARERTPSSGGKRPRADEGMEVDEKAEAEAPKKQKIDVEA